MKVEFSTIFIIVGGVLTLIGAGFASYEALRDKDTTIELTKKQVEIAEKSLKHITGGDSWAYLTSGLHSAHGVLDQPFAIIVQLVGDYPLYDLTVTLEEIKRNADHSYNSKEILSRNIGTLTKSIRRPEIIDVMTLPKNKEKVEYIARLKARNGEIMQHWIFIKKSDGNWAVATKVYRFELKENGAFAKKDLHLQIDNDFPDKHIAWIEF